MKPGIRRCFAVLDFSFTPSALSAKSGEPITIKLENKGTMEHDFTIEGHEDAKVVAKMPGSTVTGRVTLPAGTCTVYCSVPGHRESGMVGTLTVT